MVFWGDPQQLRALLRAANCGTANPTQFDHREWSAETRRVIRRYCTPCPARSLCVQTVLGPTHQATFDGIAGGLVWRDGRQIPDPEIHGRIK